MGELNDEEIKGNIFVELTRILQTHISLSV